MSEHYDFHYQPTGSGAISGQQVLEQTEDAINELGDYVNDNVGGAMDVAQQALETAQNAEQDAQTALDTANSFSDAIQSAQQDASTALSTAQTAQTTASNANNTAIQAQQDASSAVTTANNASGQVSTLSGTVTALGQRVTTAEGNIGQNTSDITALTTRVGTAEGNITTLQNDVSIAQGNASSAMATAGTVKQQSYVLRYSSSSVTDNSTIAYSTLDNTDNVKTGDKVIDVDGKIFSIVSVDTANSTVTVGSALIDLAQDSNVVHKSGDETISGQKTFRDQTLVYNLDNTANTPNIILKNSRFSRGSTTELDTQYIRFTDKSSKNCGQLSCYGNSAGNTLISLFASNTDSNNQTINSYVTLSKASSGDSSFYPNNDNETTLGTSSKKWSKIYGTEYYYGSNNVEFSTKFVTTDTAQTISGNKNFKGLITTVPDSPLWPVTNNTTADITSLAVNCVHIESRTPGSLSDLSNGAWYVAQIGTGCFFFRQNSGTDVRYKHFPTNVVSKLCLMSNNNKFISDLCPDTTNSYNLGDSTNKWSTINGVEPSSLSLPDLSNGIDISSYLDVSQSSTNYYTPPANGWISITITTSVRGSIQIECGSGFRSCVYSCTDSDNPSDFITSIFIPCVKNDNVTIYFRCSSGGTIKYAKFFPCQGNV